jgi:hypothetical protein
MLVYNAGKLIYRKNLKYILLIQKIQLDYI